MSNKLNSIDANTGIMVLPTDSVWENVVEYLKWLARSNFVYHIDDNPEDIENFTDEQIVVLRSNSDIMWSFATSELKGGNLWKVYGDELELLKNLSYN